MENNPMQDRPCEAAPAAAEAPQQQAPQQPRYAPPQQPYPPYPPQQPYGAPYPPQQPQQPQQPRYPVPPYGAQPPISVQRDINDAKGLGITSFVLGILGMLLWIIPVLNFMFSIGAIVCASIALAKGGAVGKAHAGAGLTTGILAFFGALAQVTVFSLIKNIIHQITTFGGLMGDMGGILSWLLQLFGGY